MTRGRPLLEAFGVGPGALLSLAGGGGKTSLMYALARAAVAAGQTVVTTTTTRIFPPGAEESPALLVLDESPGAEVRLPHLVAEHRHVTLVRRRNPDGKLAGVAPALVNALAAERVADLIVVEADGSAGRPLKAARDGEPVFASSSTHTVVVAGVEVIGTTLSEEHVFRSALAAEIAGIPIGAPVTVDVAVALLVGPRGVARAAPPASRLIAFVNKVESPAREPVALALARALLGATGRRPERVVIGSVREAAAGFTLLDAP